MDCKSVSKDDCVFVHVISLRSLPGVETIYTNVKLYDV